MKPRDPQFTNLSPLPPHRHPKCPCPKQNSLFICKIHSVLSLPTSAKSTPIYLAVQSRNHKNLNSCFSSTWQCQSYSFHLQNYSPVHSLLSIPTITTFVQVFSDCPWTPWCPCSISSLYNQSFMVPPMQEF